MSTAPDDVGGRYEVVVQSGRGAVIVARLRAASHGGRVRLARLRRWLRTPEGRRAAANTGRGLTLAAVLLGGWVLARRWAGAAQSAATALVTGFRRVTGAVEASVTGVRYALSLRWLAQLLRWWSFLSRSRSRSGARHQGHLHCSDCHARIRADARVCFRCGRRRDGRGDRHLDLGDGGQQWGLVAAAVWTWRVAALRLYRRCPDCRRLVHADARVCRCCGHRRQD